MIRMTSWTLEQRPLETRSANSKPISIMPQTCSVLQASVVRSLFSSSRSNLIFIVPGTKNAELDALISAQPRTKEDFQKLSSRIVEYIVKRHQSKPLYATFVEQLARDISQPLKDVEVRKVASSLTTLANEKQKEQRDKASGKKKKAGKPILGGSKASGKGYVKFHQSSSNTALMFHSLRHDTNMYDEALDDFGNDPNDFM